jgi:predicted nucleic acid-binding protein
MSAAEAFFDTNVLLYLFSEDAAKAARAEALIAQGGVISVQVLNEFAAVTRGKFRLEWAVVHDALTAFRQVLHVEALTVAVHEQGVAFAERYRLGVYDAQILSAAALAGCSTVYSEDMQDGLKVGDGLVVRNPFAGP